MMPVEEYEPTPEQNQKRRTNFTYHPPNDAQIERMKYLREIGNDLSFALDQSCPPSRELSLAQTKLEEAVMWANAAIARNEHGQVGDGV